MKHKLTYKGNELECYKKAKRYVAKVNNWTHECNNLTDSFNWIRKIAKEEK